jgi:hypothetical protein
VVAAARVALDCTCGRSVGKPLQPLLDALDHLCHQVEGDPEVEREFYAANTPEEMVDLVVSTGILIDAEDFCALLRSGSTEHWEVRGDDQNNPITHLLRVFSIKC